MCDCDERHASLRGAETAGVNAGKFMSSCSATRQTAASAAGDALARRRRAWLECGICLLRVEIRRLRPLHLECWHIATATKTTGRGDGQPSTAKSPCIWL